MLLPPKITLWIEKQKSLLILRCQWAPLDACDFLSLIFILDIAKSEGKLQLEIINFAMGIPCTPRNYQDLTVTFSMRL